MLPTAYWAHEQALRAARSAVGPRHECAQQDPGGSLGGLRLGEVHPDVLDLQELVQTFLSTQPAIAALLHPTEGRKRLHTLPGTVHMDHAGLHLTRHGMRTPQVLRM